MRKKQIQYIYENKLDGCFDECSLDCGLYTNRKGERQVNVNVHYITIDCWASDVRFLVS